MTLPPGNRTRARHARWRCIRARRLGPGAWALELIAGEVQRVKTEHGNEAIYGGTGAARPSVCAATDAERREMRHRICQRERRTPTELARRSSNVRGHLANMRKARESAGGLGAQFDPQVRIKKTHSLHEVLECAELPQSNGVDALLWIGRF